MAEVLLYGSIYDSTARKFVEDIDAVIASGDQELIVRINTNGGDVGAGWGMVTKFSEFPGTKKVKIDGKAYSMGAAFALFADDVETNDLAQAMYHRAGSYFENEEWYKAEGYDQMINNANVGLEKAMKNKLNIPKFNEIMATKPNAQGKKFKDLFSMDSRLNIFLNYKEMKDVGMVNRVVKVTPAKRKEVNAHVMECAAFYDGGTANMLLPEVTAEAPDQPNTENSNTHKNTEAMTAEDFKRKHPEAYNAIVASAEKTGAEKERDRVMAWQKFGHVDAEAVKDGIESGKSLMDNQVVFADLMIKMNDPKRVATATAAAADATTTATTEDNAVEGGGEKTEVEAAQTMIDAALGVKPEKK